MAQSRLQLASLLLALASCATDGTSESDQAPAGAVAPPVELLPEQNVPVSAFASPQKVLDDEPGVAQFAPGESAPEPPGQPSVMAAEGPEPPSAEPAHTGERVFASDVLHTIDITVERVHLAQLESDLETACRASSATTVAPWPRPAFARKATARCAV